LIFSSSILFTVTFVEPAEWKDSTGAQLKDEVARVGGILLIMGILHAANVVALPIIGQLLSHRGLGSDGQDSDGSVPPTTPPVGPGTWLLHIEPAPGSNPSRRGDHRLSAVVAARPDQEPCGQHADHGDDDDLEP
jgi:hypothetical protein